MENYLKQLDIDAGVVVDIGGSALPVKYRLNSFNFREYVIMDNNLEKSYHEDFTKPTYELDLNKWDCCKMNYKGVRDWRLKPDPQKQGADIIFCLEVMEYIFDLDSCFRCFDFLMTDRRDSPRTIFLSFPQVYPFHKPESADCLRYTKTGVYKILDKYDFSVVDMVDRVDKTGKLAEFYRADGMHGVGDLSVTGFIVEARKK